MSRPKAETFYKLPKPLAEFEHQEWKMDNNNFAPVVQQWLHALPPITRAWLVSTVIITGLANLNVIDPTYLYLHQWSDVWGTGSKIEAWRCVVYDQFL